jgi:hypothetical protein
MFDHLASLVAAGQIATPIPATLGFEQVTQALKTAVESGGKVLFTPRQIL